MKDPAIHRPLMRYFLARYGAFYNYFSWSPTWELAEMGPQRGDPFWEFNLDEMMDYLVSIDPGYLDTGGTHRFRLQGVHDQARTDWEGWQSILHRQQPSRSVVGPTGLGGLNGNTRMADWPTNSAGWDSGFNYPGVIIGSEDIWEFCDGEHGKPRNREQVRRGLVGGLFANVLPVYNELFSDGMGENPVNDTSWPCDPDGPPPNGPLIGLGNGAGELDVRWWLDWWYGAVTYRSPDFRMLNSPTCATDNICSGIPGQEYVLYREGPGNVSLNLTGYPYWFDAWVQDVGNRVWYPVPGGVLGGGTLGWYSSYANDTAVFLRKRP